MDRSFYENKNHGKLSFPYIVYRGKLPEYIREYPVHWHKEMEIIYVVSGRGVITVQTTRYEAETGDIILIQPEMIHSIKQQKDYEMEYFNILFDFRLLESSQNSCYEKYFKPLYNHRKAAPVHLHKNEELTKLLTPYIDELIIYRREKYTSQELMVKSNLYAIIHHIYNFCRDSDDELQHLNRNYDEIKKILVYIQENYGNKMVVEQAAEMTNFSPSYFSKLFRQLTGKSFGKYLKEYRLEVACDKLINTKMRITDIAEETGFCNLPHFTRSFEGKYGVTPIMYRKSKQ